MAGRLAPHLRGEPVGLPAVWRPHTCGRYHRGPRRDPEDSHAPRAPDRGVSAPAAAVRPVRLELSPSTGAGPTPGGVSARRCLATDHRPVGFPTAAPAQRENPSATPTRRLCAVLLRSTRELGARPRWGRSVSLRGKRPFIAPICFTPHVMPPMIDKPEPRWREPRFRHAGYSMWR